MLVGTFLRRWIDVLAGVYFAGREALRARQSLIVACENGHFIVRRAQPNRVSILQPEQRDEAEGDTVVAVLSAGTPASAEVMRAARSGFVILELPAVMVVVRRITVPAQARAFLPGIVRNQIERLSPWHADQAVYGFDAEVNAEEAATLDVRVLIAPRAAIDGARAELAAIGLPVDRIVTCQRNADAVKSITLCHDLGCFDSPRER